MVSLLISLHLITKHTLVTWAQVILLFPVLDEPVCQAGSDVPLADAPPPPVSSPVDGDKPSDVEPRFTLPVVKRGRGRPKQAQRLTSFNSKRVPKRARQPAPQSRTSGRLPKQGKKRAPVQSKMRAPPATLAGAFNTNGGRPQTPVYAAAAEKVEVTPEKVHITLIIVRLLRLYSTVMFC